MFSRLKKSLQGWELYRLAESIKSAFKARNHMWNLRSLPLGRGGGKEETRIVSHRGGLILPLKRNEESSKKGPFLSSIMQKV